MSEWIDVCPENDFPPGEWRSLDVDGAQVAVFNLDGKYYAIEDTCTHDGGGLTGGKVEGEEVIYPRHGARFSIKTGEALTAPAYEAVASLPVRINNGIVQVRDDRWD